MSESEAREQGYAAGKIDERLEGHDRHFALINGSLEKVATNLAIQTLAIQSLVDQAKASEATVLATAKALKEADEARRNKSDSSWTPVQRLIAVVGGLAVVIGATLGIATYLRH